MAMPKTAAAIPRLFSLKNDLDYPQTAGKDPQNAPYGLLFGAIQAYIHDRSLRGKTLRKWKSHELRQGLLKISATFLDEHGETYWPDNPAAPNSRKWQIGSHREYLRNKLAQVLYRMVCYRVRYETYKQKTNPDDFFSGQGSQGNNLVDLTQVNEPNVKASHHSENQSGTASREYTTVIFRAKESPRPAAISLGGTLPASAPSSSETSERLHTASIDTSTEVNKDLAQAAAQSAAPPSSPIAPDAAGISAEAKAPETSAAPEKKKTTRAPRGSRVYEKTSASEKPQRLITLQQRHFYREQSVSDPFPGEEQEETNDLYEFRPSPVADPFLAGPGQIQETTSAAAEDSGSSLPPTGEAHLQTNQAEAQRTPIASGNMENRTQQAQNVQIQIHYTIKRHDTDEPSWMPWKLSNGIKDLSLDAVVRSLPLRISPEAETLRFTLEGPGYTALMSWFVPFGDEPHFRRMKSCLEKRLKRYRKDCGSSGGSNLEMHIVVEVLEDERMIDRDQTRDSVEDEEEVNY